jgi:hypothetical protein
MSAALGMLIVLCCLAVVVLSLRREGRRWLGLPLAIVAARAAVDAGLPLLLPAAIDRAEVFGFIGSPSTSEQVIGATLLSVSYASIAAGFVWAAKMVRGRSVHVASHTADYTRVLRAGITMFAVGLLAHAVVFAFLTQQVSLTGIAAARAAFTAESALSSSLYHYARLLMPALTVGALAIVLASGHVRQHTATAVIAAAVCVGVQALLGTRGGTIKTALAIACVWHYGVRPIRPRQAVIGALAVIIGLGYINLVRFGADSASEITRLAASSILVTRSVPDAAYAVRTFPDDHPYLDGETVIAGLSHALPGLKTDARNFWEFVVDEYYGGVSPMAGLGGGNFALAAEHYANGGWLATVGLGIAFGAVFGILFELQLLRPRNPFLLILAAYTLTVFVGAIEGRIAQLTATLAFGGIIPVASLAAMAVPGSPLAARFRGFLGAIVVTVVMYLLVQSLGVLPEFRYVVHLTLLLAYWAGLRCVIAPHSRSMPGRRPLVSAFSNPQSSLGCQ